MRIIDGSTHHHRHVPGNTPQACNKFKQTCSRSVCGQLVVCVTAGDMNLSRDEVLETMQDASGFPDSVRVVGNTRDFLIGMLSAQQLAAAADGPRQHACWRRGNGSGRCNATGLAATQDQPQEAASSSSDSSVQECERIRGLAEAGARELALLLMERIRHEKPERRGGGGGSSGTCGRGSRGGNRGGFTAYYMSMKDIAVNFAGIFGVGGRAGAHIICFQGTWR